MRKIKNKKHIFIGVMACSLVSLLTIGFSTWIISIDKPTGDYSVPVSIDVLDIATVITEGQIDKKNPSISIGCPENVGESGVISGESSEDLSLPISGSLIVADEMVSKVSGISISLSASNSTSGETDTNKVTISQTDVFGRSGEKSYLSLSQDNITLSASSFKDYTKVDGYQIYEFDLNDFAITYGSYFDDGDSSTTDNPSNFYNTKIQALREEYLNGDINVDTYLNAISTAKKEIADMQTEISNLKITISTVISEQIKPEKER